MSKTDLSDWYKSVIASPSEVDYAEALDWFGLRRTEVPPAPPRPKLWKLEIHPDASAEQKKHFQDWIRP